MSHVEEEERIREEIEELKKTIRDITASTSSQPNGPAHGMVRNMARKLGRLKLRLYTYKFRN